MRNTESTLRQLVREMAQMPADTDQEGQRINGLQFKRAADICRSLGDKALLARGFQASSIAGSHYITTEGPTEKGRMASVYATRPTLRALVDGLAEKFDLGSLVYCGVKGGKYVKLFGTEYIVFPTEPFKVIYNPDVDDSGGWTGRNGPEAVPAAIEGYIEDWPKLGYRGEVILDTPAYYLINLQWAADTFQNLTTRHRDGIPRPVRPVMSARELQRQEIERKYGLTRPASAGTSRASRGDEMMDVTTYAELAPYFEWMWSKLSGREVRA